MNEKITASKSFIKFSLKKILFSKRIIAVIAIIGFISAIMIYASTLDVDRLSQGANLLDTLILSFFIPIVTMFYGSSILRDDIEDQSITQVLTCPLSRTSTYILYYISLIISLAVITSLITLSGFLAFFLPLKIDADALSILLNMVVLSILGSIVYSSLFLTVSVLLEKSIYFGLFYAFIWEGFIGSIPGRIQEFSIKHYIRSIASEWIEYGSISRFSGYSIGNAFLILFILTVVLIVIGILLFRNKEFP